MFYQSNLNMLLLKVLRSSEIILSLIVEKLSENLNETAIKNKLAS